MNLTIKRGDAIVSSTSVQQGTAQHHEKDFDILLGKDVLVVKGRGGAPFLTVQFADRTVVMDVLNVPHVDVAKREAEEAKVAAKK